MREGQVVVLWLSEAQDYPAGGTLSGNTCEEASGAFGGEGEQQ